MRPPRTLALSLALGTLACSSPFPCNRYCWSHQQLVADVTDEHMTGVPDGHFDATCTRFLDLKLWHPPLPPFGWYAAEQCVEGDVHQVIAQTVDAIEDPAIDASQACDVTDLQVYADFVQTLASQARDACVAHLSCNGAPAGCDIDPSTPENDACTVSSAETLCDQAVLGPALTALTDLTNGPGAAQPQRDGTVIEYVADPQDCQPILQGDTDGGPSCDDPAGGGGGEGQDESSGSDGSSGGSMLEPFGDLDTLVTCATPGTCTVEPALFVAVQSNFGIFHDEGIRLALVDVPALGRGVQLSGLERHEASGQLLGALGLQNGDVITHVDGAWVLAPGVLERLVLALPTAAAWRLTVRRAVGGRWGTVEVIVTRGG